MKFEHSTQAQNLAELRRRFKASSKSECARMARWLYNNLTVAQIKNLFNLSDAQVTALRARLLALKQHQDAIDAAVGE